MYDGMTVYDMILWE